MLHPGVSRADDLQVSQPDFFASGPAQAPAPVFGAASVFGAAPVFGAVPAPVVAATPAPKSSPWPWIAGAAGVLALIVAIAVVLWPHSTPSGPDLPMARLFGQQTRLQLPQPVTSDDCKAAVRAFPKIAADARATAAFVDGCLTAG